MPRHAGLPRQPAADPACSTTRSRMLDETGAAPEDVDRALRAGAGWPMGPLALIDLIGLDVQVHAAEALWQAHREERLAPPARLRADGRGRAPGPQGRPRLLRLRASRAGGLDRRRSSRSFYSRRTACGTLLPIMGPCDASRPSSSWSCVVLLALPVGASARAPGLARVEGNGDLDFTTKTRRAALRRGRGRPRASGPAGARRRASSPAPTRAPCARCAMRRKIRGSNTYEWRLFAPVRVFILGAQLPPVHRRRRRALHGRHHRHGHARRAGPGRADGRCRRRAAALRRLHGRRRRAADRGRDVPARRLP